MNFLKNLLEHLRGMKRGDADYRKLADAGKAVAPLAQPIIEAALAKHGLPATPEAAAQVLIGAATTKLSLPAPVAAGLAVLAAQAIAPK